MPPIVLGLGDNAEWNDPLNLYSGKTPTFGLGDQSSASASAPKVAPDMPARPQGMSERDWNDTVDTIIAEAVGEGEAGMSAVANVIRNRSNVRGKGIGDIVREPHQFTGYEKPGADTVKAMRDPATRRQAEGILASVLAGQGQDPTGGADHYHADSVSPDWAPSMPQTATIGRHKFYNSKGERTTPTATTAFVPENDPLGLYGPNDQFKDLLQGDKTTSAPNPEGKGLARLVREPEDAPAGSGGKLHFAHAGQEKIAPQFASILSDTSQALGRDFTITSGYRSPNHPVEAGKRTGPGQHATGTASDISMKGMSTGERQQLVRELRARGINRFGVYKNTPDMLHVDMKDQTGNGEPWFMYDRSNGNMKHAPAWFQEVAKKPNTVDGLRPFRPGETRPNADGSYSTEVSTTWKLSDGSWVNVPSLWMDKGGPKQFAPDDEEGILGAMREYETKNGQTFARFKTEAEATAAAEARSAQGGAGAGNTIVADADFKSSDGLGLYSGQANPFDAQVKARTEAVAAARRQQEETEQRAAIESGNAAADKQQSESNGRYVSVPESEADQWAKTWSDENQSQGMVGDVGRMLGAGNAGVALAVREAVGMIPGVGDSIVSGVDAVDEWINGKPVDERLDQYIDRANASVTPRQAEADAKTWWDDEKGTLGPAWSDPRSYLRGVAESAPGTIYTMAPGVALARGAYLGAIAAGASAPVAAGAAAKAALISGGISEGILGGGDSARNIKERISQIPREQLAQSDAVKAMVAGGKTVDEAIAALTEDAATQAFVISGVTTGLFGGMGDHALAKIVAEGVQGTIGRRVMSGLLRGAVGEGIFEEMPQGVTQAISENAAMRTVNPDQDLMEGVAEAAASGVAIGGAMGGGMGAAGGAARPANTAAPRPQPQAPEPDNRGPLRRSVDHGMERETARAAEAAPVPPAPVSGGEPIKGATVRIDADGLEPIMGTVESYDGDEVVVVDNSSGEIYQVPVGNVTQIAPPIGDYTPPHLQQSSLPETSSDPALEPLAPMAAERTTEVPPRSEDKPATEKRPTRPQAGDRVIIDDEAVGRFPARIERYENDGTEAVVVNDAGEPFQVPVTAMNVSGLTPQQVEQQELERNPPIEREVGDAGPNSRKILNKNVVLPDDNHAALYDLGREQVIAKRLGGSTRIDIDSVLPAERKRLADAFGVKVEEIASMADDYRYRAERAAKEAKSTLPVKMHPLNERLLKQRQAARSKDAMVEPASTDADATWWDVDLKANERKSILEKAGVQRPEKVMWQNLTPAIKKKLTDVRDAQSAAADDVRTLSGFITESEEWLRKHDAQDDPDIAEFLERGARAHEEEKQSDPDDWSDDEKRAYSSGDWEQFSKLRGYSNAEIENYRQYQVLANRLIDRYGTDFAAGLEYDYASYRTEEGDAGDVSIDDSANEAATSPTNDLPEPTQAQKEAGNYKVGRLKLGGLDISIENPAGSERKGVSSSGRAWSVKMKSHYGYIRGTVGRDKDHIDVFVRPGTEKLDDTSPVFVVDQRDPARGRFDEHKVMAGFDNEAQARAAYLENYTADWKGLGDISQTTLGDFKTWLASGKTSEPFAPKWFASKEKADGYVSKNKMGSTHEVVQRGKRFEVLEKTRAKPAVESTKPTGFDPNEYPWSDVWGSDDDVISDALSRIASVNGGDQAISDAVKANVSNKDLLALIDARWGEGGAGGRRYMIETRKGPIVTIIMEKDDGNLRVVLRGKDLAEAIRKEFVVSLADMERAHEAREKAAKADKRPPAADTNVAIPDSTARTTDKAPPKAKPKKVTGQKAVDRYENYFRPGRDVQGYSGTDRVIRFNREGELGWTVTVAEVKPNSTLDRERTHSTTPSERDLARWERDNPVPDKAKPVPMAPQRAQSRPPEVVSADAPGIDLWRGASKAEVAAIKAGEYEFRPSHQGIMFTNDRGTAGDFGAAKASETLAIKIPTDAKILDRKDLRNRSKEYDDVMLASAKRPGFTLDDRHPFFRAEARERGYDVVTYPSGTGTYQVYEILNADIIQIVDPATIVEKPSKPAVSANTIFTSDAAAKARELLRKKFSGNTLNSGIDPELMQAGITLAGYHIEKGARTFAAYASAMLADLGEGARPYLKSWYMGVKYDPRATAFDGMSSAAEVEGVDVSTFTGESNEPEQLDRSGAGTLEGVSAEPVQGTESGRDAGRNAEGRGGSNVSGNRPAGASRVQPGRGVADGEGDLFAPATGEQPAAATERKQQQRPDGRGAQRTEDSGNPVAVPAQQRPTSYVITADDGLGEGGQKAKFRGNVAAIELVKKLDEEKRPATRDEQSVLAKWVGWGGLRAAFAREDGSVAKGWEKEAAQLKGLLTKAEYAAAESSTRNAHYTAPDIVDAAWKIVQRLGYTGGQILEPSVGAGNFIGMMPGGVRASSHVTGVELDRITGSIAKNLYPDANIQAPIGFEKLTVPDGYFDLAIGNPPFGSERVYDKQRTHLNKLSIHNFFFAKAVEALRPGGLLAMVVTNRFLDGQSAAARNLIHSKADFIGAIRLPNNAFLKNAGTEVTTDIVLLQRREEGQAPKSSEWLEVGDYRGKDGNSVPLNQYFAKNPEMMLGDFGAYGTMYGPDEPALIARGGQDTPAELAKAIEKLPQNIVTSALPPVAAETVIVPETVSDVQVGTMFAAPDGSVHLRTPDHIGQATSKAVDFPNETARERVSGMVRVRDAFAKLRRAQISETAGEQQVDNLRKRLNTLYDAFVNKHGPINSDANKRLFRDDPTWPQISALEQDFDKGTSAAMAKKTGEKSRPATARKAAIFTKRTQQPYRRPTSASTAKDALATVLNDYGRVNLDAMSELYGKSADAIVDELGPLIYKTPSGAFETADQYLSGNVKQKLAEAERAAETDTAYRRNVNALRDVIPADIEAIDIDVKPGAPWVPAANVEQFISHISGGSIKPKAFYSKGNAKWDIDVPGVTPAAQTQWGTDRAGVGTVLSSVLNGQSITIYDRTTDGKSVVNQAATDAANEKAERVKAEWRRWLWQDDTRRDDLARLYNDTFNTDVLQQYDGSHLTLPGKVGDDIIDLRPSQKNFIWRTLQSGTALADHTVGAGKTFAAIASVMEKRRTGQARKPMMVVPNHLVGQWAADFVRLYPGAKVLAATKQDFEKDRRKRLFARIATGDWDAVIVAHSSFGRIGMTPEYEAQFIQQQMDDLEASMSELRRATGEKSRNVAQLTKWRDSLKTKMERLLDAGRKDDGLTFDELGVDALYVDEAHEFKNLAYSTSMQRVAGLGNMSGSSKAADLYMKSRFVLEKTGGNNLVFLSGTPLSNTMAEMFTVQRYLDEKTLRAMGIAHFDAWARVFGEVVTDWELSPSGQYKLNSRFAKFVNVPELMQRYRSFADVITNDDIKAQLAAQGKKFPLPKVKGGKPQNIVVERSADQAAFIGEGKTDDAGNLEFPRGSLVWRAENLPPKAEKGKDNMLKVMSDARKAALDMRLIDPGYGDVRGSKVHRAADEMTRIYKDWTAERGTQLVFIDLSTPKKAQAAEAARIRDLMERADKGDEAAIEALDKVSPDELLALDSSFSVYDDLKQKLIDRGIPESEIAFIHDANTEAQKEELFGKVRSGRTRFLFGSTAKMGAGTNVQNRLVGLHHLDAPWRPSDLEQRDGRGIRQGNELYAQDPDGFEIEILRYATKNTLDARQWQTIEAKARFIQQVRKGDMKTREIEDIAGEAANAAEMKAAASGNPLILEEMDTRRKLRQLEAQSVEHDREQHRIKRRIVSLTEEADAVEASLPKVEADAKTAEAIPADFNGTINGEAFEKRKDFGAAIAAAMRKELIDKEGVTEIGSFGGFKIGIEAMGYGRAFEVTITGQKEYSVPVADASDVDATGLATRIANTVKRLPNQPALDRERVSDIRSQIPMLEKQIGEWGSAGQLAETSDRHRRLLDALKPKPKGAAPAPAVNIDTAEFDPPIQNKRPDPIESTANNLQSVGLPTPPTGKAIFQWAKDTITRFGKSGHEYLMAVDDDGTVVEFGTAKQKASTGISNKLAGAMKNPDRRLVVFHNHPGNGPLSVADMSLLAAPGMHSVWAFGANGNDMRGSLTPEGERLAQGADAVENWRRSLDAAREGVDRFLRPLVEQGVFDAAQATEAYWQAVPLIAQKAGLIDISSNSKYDPSAIEGLEAKLDTLAVAMKGHISDGSASYSKSNISGRSARNVRHVAEVEGLARGSEPLVTPRTGPTGLSETSAPNYQRKEQPAGRAQQVTQARVVQDLRGKLTDIQPAILKAIPLNYFSELARPGMEAVGDYLRVKRLMDAYRGTKHADADAIAQDWLKYTRLGFSGKDKAKAKELSDLMHDSTLAGVDPSLTDEETMAMPGYEALRRRYVAMPPKGRELYNKVRNAYGAQAKELDDILLDNVRKAQEIAKKNAEERYKKTLQKIKDVGLSGLDRKNAEEDAASAYKAETTKSAWAAKARLTRMRIAFEQSRVKGPYFPLGRFGRYFVTVRNIDGQVLSFSKHETAAERDRMAADLRSEYPAGKVEIGVMEAGSDLRKAMDPRIVAEIEEILGGANIGGDVMDQIWQRYLESMPDLSARKRFIHRKGTSGFSKDALRVFSSAMFHAAHQMARLKYGLELQELVNETVDQAKASDDQTRAMTLANELSSRHKWVMNPTGGKVAQTMTSTAFVWYLAASPGAALVNMTQTVMLGLPVLGAKFGGFKKAAAALGKASADSVAGKGTVVSDRRTRDERQAMNAFYESGLIDRTQSHDLAGVGETGVEYSPLRAKVMEKISWAFHRAEVWNREVTALAAYRMAREAGQNMSDAIDTAHDLTWKTHFDYSNSSRPALLQNDFAKVALVFRQHNINMLYRVIRDIHQSVKGETPQARREARYQLAGIMGMMAAMAGVTGTMGFSVAMMIAGAMFGDDDDPMAFEDKFKADVVDILGPQLGGVVLNGAPGHYLGIDLSSRIGMPDLWFRSPTRELQGKQEYQYWLAQSLGATVSLGEQLYTGFRVMTDDGDIARGVEMMAPKAVRDLMKAYRYSQEGLTTVGRDEILPQDAIGPADIIAQAFGFTPAKISETWERNSALKNAETAVKQKRQRLINKWAMATMAGDKETASDALDGIKAFNRVKIHAGFQIKADTLKRSIQTRAKNAAKRHDGVLIGNNALGTALRDRLADPVYR